MCWSVLILWQDTTDVEMFQSLITTTAHPPLAEPPHVLNSVIAPLRHKVAATQQPHQETKYKGKCVASIY